jgi:hypothetical protein
MANETELALQIEDLKREHATLMRAARLLLALGVLVLAVVCVRSALTIPNMTNVFHDMLPGESLPASTQFVSRHPAAFLASAIILGLIGLGMVLVDKKPRLVGAAIVAALLLLQWQLVSSALQEPFFKLLEQIGEPEVENSTATKQPGK